MPEMTNNPLVEFRDVSFAHAAATRPVISHLSFKVHEGETLVLLGESGCGKTTTLKLINRLFLPSAGEVRVEGKATTSWDRIRLRRRTGYVIQEGGLFPHFTVARNIGLVPSLEGWDQQRTEHRVDELLSLVGPEPSELPKAIRTCSFHLLRSVTCIVLLNLISGTSLARKYVNDDEHPSVTCSAP